MKDILCIGLFVFFVYVLVDVSVRMSEEHMQWQ